MSAAFPESGKRIVFYLFHDSRGEVDDFVTHKLRALRPFADHIFVIVNGSLKTSARITLQGVSDTVWERENVGFDVWGYKSALKHMGQERLAEFDELILMNYTWFGPVRSFAPMFDRMGARELDFWGMTEHGGGTPNPFTGTGTMPRHMQSHWLAVRRSMFQSEQWRRYWDDMPMITTYIESVLNHESRFTKHFLDAGFTGEAAFPLEDFSTDHPALLEPDALMDAGCPALKRRVFFHYPPFMDRHAVIGRWTLQKAEAYGYPVALAYQNLARTTPPKTLNVAAGMLEVLPDVAETYDPDRPLRIAAIVHIFYEDMTDELLDRVAMLPSAYDAYITTTDESKATHIRAVIAGRADPLLRRSEVRVLPSNRGRDLSALFIGCSDVLRSGAYDLIVKVHSKKTVQQSHNAGLFFKRQQMENVLSSPGYAANVLGLFQREPGLGIVFPPMIHVGYPTMGRAWFANRHPVEVMCKKLGITVPRDEVSPLAPFGCMWVARPEALRLLADVDWHYTDYAEAKDHHDGSLAHVQERIVPLAAAEMGYHARTIINAEHAAISHTMLDYELDQISSTTPGYPIDQIQLLHLAGWLGDGHARTFARAYMRINRPKTARALLPLVRVARRAMHVARVAKVRLLPRRPATDEGELL